MTRLFNAPLGMAALLALPGQAAAPPSSPSDDGVRFPPDAGIVRVTDRGARPDDGVDDTAALRSIIAAAIDGPSRYAAPRLIYLPRGTYDLSGPLEARVGAGGWSHGWRAGFLLVGESRTGTILKLKEGAEGFGDKTAPRAVLATGSENPPDARGGGNQAFRHTICNLTIDTGKKNLGAVGIDYLANNRGTVRDVIIRAGDGEGHTGVLLTRPWPGPALLKNVRIEGFDVGVRTAHYQYSMTIEHLALAGQKQAGIVNTQNVLSIRGLTSRNTVPVIQSTSDSGHITLLDARFSGGALGEAAIVGKAKLFVRNLVCEGYGTVIDRTGVGAANVPGGTKAVVTEYVSQPVASAFSPGPAAATSLNLPVRETPTFHTNDQSRWAKAGNGSAGIQAAIDSGKPIVYLPNGAYKIDKTLILRGNVRKIIGFQSSIGPRKGVPVDPLIRFESTTADTVILEHLWLDGVVEHASKKALVVRHCDLNRGYRNTATGTGALFVEDVIGKPYHIRYPQSVWARQLNAEFGDAPLIENSGTLWILGLKTEGQMTAIKTVNGATELLGALLYPLRAVKPDVPMFESVNSRVSLVYTHNGSHNHPVQVRETRAGQTRELLKTNLPGRGPALYVGYPAAAAAPKVAR